MANSLPSYGVLSMQQFPALHSKAAQLKTYSTNFTAEIENAGTAISVGYQDAVSASLWDPTNKYTSADETISAKTVTLNEPFYVEFYLSPNQMKSYGETYLQKRMETAAIGVCNEVKKKALEMVATSTAPVVATISASAHKMDTVMSASTVLITSGSVGQQTFLAPTTVYNALISEAKSANYKITTVVNNGRAEFVYDLFPQVTVVLEPGLTAPVIATPDAVALALRLPDQLEGYSRTIFTDEETGVSIAVDMLQDTVGGKILGRAQASLGYSVGRPGAIARFANL